MFGTALTGLGLFAPSAALADCVAGSGILSSLITCQSSGTLGAGGWDGSATNGLTIQVLSSNDGTNIIPTVTTPPSTSSTLLSAGTGSVLSNFGGTFGNGTAIVFGIDAGSSGNSAISMGGGSTVNNTSNSTIQGTVTFGSATGTAVNTFNNNYTTTAGASDLEGDITSVGNTTINNQGFMGYNTSTNITQTGAGTVTINNGVAGGYASPINGIENGFIWGNINTQGDTVLNNYGGGTAQVGNGTGLIAGDTGAVIRYDVTVGTGGTGTSTINNDGTIDGLVTMSDKNNTLNNTGKIGGNVGAGVTFTGTGTDVLNNSGLITGDVTGGAGNETIANTLATGVINGNINLGTGTDAISNLVGTGTITKSGSGKLTLSGDNSGYTNAGTVLAIDTGGTVAVGASNSMPTGGISIDNGTLQVTGASTFGNAITLGAGGGTVQTDAATTLSGAISGAGGLTKTGTSSLTLSGTNTYTGATNVNNGNLILSGGAAIADTGAVIVTAPGSLQVDTNEVIGSLAGSGNVLLNANLDTGGDNTSTTSSGVISGAGGLTKSGTGTFTLTGANTYSGGTTINGGTLAGNSTSLQGNILVNGGTTLLFNQTANGTYAGAMSGAGTFTKTGAGTLTLTGNNSGLTGTSNLNGGTVSIGAANNIGAGPLVFDGGTLQTTAALTLANPITLNAGGGTFNTGGDTTLSGGIGGAGALTKTGAARLILTAPSSYTGGTTVSAGILQGDAGTAIQGDIVNNAAVDFTGFEQIYADNMSGTGSVEILPGAIIGFSGTNTYSGTTTIDAGSGLYAFSTGALSPNSVVIDNAPVGTVGGDATGLNVFNDSTIKSLGGAGAVQLGSGVTLNVGDYGNYTYSGTLTGGGGNLTTFKNGGNSWTFAGTGTGLNAFTVGSVTNLTGSLTAASTTVNNGGTLNVASTGALTSPVTAVAGSALVVNGSITGDVSNAGAASGSGTVTGAFSNSGSLSPGTNGTTGIFTVVNGPFTQTSTGTLNIDLTPSNVAGTGYDQLLVTGTPGNVVLGGTLALHPKTGVLYVAGTNYDVINAAGGISGAFASTTGGTISPFLSFTTTGVVTISGTDQVYRITVARVNYATGLGSAATPNQIAVANGFQGLVTGATGDAATLVTAVDNMTVAQAQSFFDQASPEPYGAYANALYTQGELFTRQVALQMHATPNAGGGLSVWGRGYGQWGSGNNRSYRYGSHQDTYGGALGLDYRNAGLTVGGAVGYSHDKVRYNLGNSNGRVNSWQVGAYLDYAAGPIDFDLQAAYENGDINATRSINVSGIANVAAIARTATASPKGHLWRAIGTVGYNAAISSNITARPFVGLDWTDGSIDAFAESGASAADLTVSSIKVRRTDAVVGVDIGSNAGGGIAPYARLAYKYDLSDHPNNVSAMFNGVPGTAFTVSALPMGRSEFDADAGLSYSPSRNFMIFAGYEGTFRNDLKSNGVSAGFRLNFGAPPAVAPPPPPPPPPPPATQTCPDGSVIAATATCPVPPPPPPPPPPPAQKGERGA